MPVAVRVRILALSRMSPPAVTGLTHWSSRELAVYLARCEGVRVSHNSPLVVCWDNLNRHTCADMAAFIAQHKDWLTVYQLPASSGGRSI